MDVWSTQPAYAAPTAQASGRAWLEISDRDERYDITQSGVTVVGSSPSANVVLNYAFVSRKHFSIEYENGSYVCKHVKSTNGFLYNGLRIYSHEEEQFLLQDNDIIRIGKFSVGSKNSGLVTLTFHSTAYNYHDFAPTKLDSPLMTIGSAQDCNISLSGQQGVAPYHARLQRDQEGRYSLSPESMYPVYINSKRVKSSQQLEMRDKLCVGQYRFIYDGSYLVEDDGTSSVCITTKNLFKYAEPTLFDRFKKDGGKASLKELLHDVTLAIPAGKLVALVGGSGAGKSTLLDAINGTRPVQQGTVFYNNKNYYTNIADFNTQLGYVPQQDIVHMNLSVEDALYYGLKLRLPDDIHEQEVRQRINTVLDEVKLTNPEMDAATREGVMKLRVSQLSGGQRKRISIALELLPKPSI
nr:ATP-binding cassette domain-containing protein [Ktedonobacteraceae bacterium]